MPSALISKVTSISTTPRARAAARQDELPEELVLVGLLALALHHQDLHRRLVVARRGEGLGARRGHRGVLRDERLHEPASDHHAEGLRGHVEQHHRLAEGPRPRERRALDRRADGHHLVGVHPLARLAPEELRHAALDQRHAGHAAHQDHVLDVVAEQPRVVEGLPHDLDGALCTRSAVRRSKSRG
jgi:hypothetical protein